MSRKGQRAIDVRNASVVYRVYSDHRLTLRERLTMRRRSREFTQVRAVTDVSFKVKTGEVVGLIGSNGSGKSTLLSAIAGLQPLASGSIRVRGEPTLLGVGAVLDAQLSGARNVMLGCLALGMSRSEANERFDDIVDFAGLRAAIDRPMRTYSSGMRSRLHFSIATSVDPDILLVDEVLAVGDRDFRRRSLKRITDLQGSAKVVVLVTHGLHQVRKVCSRAIWIEEGRLMADGPPDDVLDQYVAFTGGADESLDRDD
ncbi:MAG TPA: ATP-binding cassette domain-containing protein [Acidimicrobiia bacterium]|nr:ATP-binding cassette domain-containing protein [Acidimicrobiia bacterium]